jgi:hypothetical protein
VIKRKEGISKEPVGTGITKEGEPCGRKEGNGRR